MRFEANIDGRVLSVEVQGGEAGPRVRLGDRERAVDLRELSPGFVHLLSEGASREVGLWRTEEGYAVLVGGRVFQVSLREGASGEAAARRPGSGPVRVSAPMPGRLVRVLVEPGQTVSEGQGLVVIEAMKMENELRSPRAGRVSQVHVSQRQAVETGALLVVVE